MNKQYNKYLTQKVLKLPIVLLFFEESEIDDFSFSINKILVDRIKYEKLGSINGQYAGLFYIEPNNDYIELRQEMLNLILAEIYNRLESYK